MSCDNEATRDFWPLLPGQLKVDFGDIAALEKIFKGLQEERNQIYDLNKLEILWLYLIIFYSVFTEKGDRIAGFLFEPIQGEAGVCTFSVALVIIIISM